MVSNNFNYQEIDKQNTHTRNQSQISNNLCKKVQNTQIFFLTENDIKKELSESF
jgi:hypothetical protein